MGLYQTPVGGIQVPAEATQASVVVSMPLEQEGVTSAPLEKTVRIIEGPKAPQETIDKDPFARTNALRQPN